MAAPSSGLAEMIARDIAAAAARLVGRDAICDTLAGKERKWIRRVSGSFQEESLSHGWPRTDCQRGKTNVPEKLVAVRFDGVASRKSR